MFADLYQPRQYGTWLTPRQGLTLGMDLHDWMRFVNRAAKVISIDPDPERRIRKAQRLNAKAMKIAIDARWIVGPTLLKIRDVIAEAEYDIESRIPARLAQLSLWNEV